MTFTIRKCFISILIILILTSCSKIYFNTTDNLAWATNTKKISVCEVSIQDWITYIVSTSFSEKDDNIYLSDHLEKISSKLPELTLEGWSNYVFKAFLRKEKQMVSQEVYDHCKHTFQKIYIPRAAWDSIKKFRLLDLPVVGINYDQAMKYVAYKENISNACDLYLKKSKNKYRYECFLPTPEQFDSFQTLLDSFHRCPYFNFKNSFCEDCPGTVKYKNHPVIKNIGKQPTYVDAYFRNYYGVYNFKGNVAEMTSVKGISKGGSCFHYASEAFAGKSQSYSKPEIWLGFRVWYRVFPK